MGGVIWTYGNSNVAPYSEQFYVGGANSIRAYTVRGIGPGGYHGNNTNYMDQTGDIKFEANAEYRFNLVGSFNGAVFLDAGNVWMMKNDEERPGAKFNLKDCWDQIALGTGFGLRYDMEFLVLRLDLGIALHSPYKTSKSGYYNIPDFKDAMSLHFAIGYPF
jgi:outer membrane protein assembly factor BamA